MSKETTVRLLGTIPLLLGAGANAQQFVTPVAHLERDGVATWSSKIVTDDGDAIVEPEETATIILSVLLEADDSALSEALAWTTFYTLGGENADRGEIAGWQILNNLDSIGGDQTTTDGVSLFNTRGGQFPFSPLFVIDNPIDVLAFEWTTDDFAGYAVTYKTHSALLDIAPHTITAWATPGAWDKATTTIYEVNEVTVTFEVASACGADMNQDGQLNVLDFVAFQLAWQAGESIADCDANGRFDIIDFVCFQELFTSGCG